jgi:PAS domain S-box-containing protein
MPDLTISTLERARTDVATLRKGLGDLALLLDEQTRALLLLRDAATSAAALKRALAETEPTAAHTAQIMPLVAELKNFLDRLQASLDAQSKDQEQLRALFDVSRAVNSTLDLADVLNITMDAIIQVTRAERGFVMLRNEATGELEFQAARDLDRATIASPGFEVSRSVIRRVALEGKPVIATDAQSDPRFATQESVMILNLRSVLCVPMILKGQVTGVVYVDNRMRRGAFSEQDKNFLSAFADQAAVAIENARLFESVRLKMQEIATLKNFQDNIFRSIASGVIATDLTDRITAFNRAAEVILATPAEQTLGKDYVQALPFVSTTPLPDWVARVKSEKERIIAAEIDAHHPERGDVNLSVSVSSLTNAAAQPLGVAIVVDDLTEKRRLEAVRQMFRRYVAPVVVDRLPANPDELRLGGQRQEITILFADLRGFTACAEKLAPEQLVEVLNQYLTLAADAILAQEGTLDKFMGDAVMGLFNAPLPQPDHALRAVRAALKMCAGLAALHQRLPEALRLSFGIGIHTGEAVVGNIGTDQQMNFTAIGDAANLAKRLQENAAGGQILLSVAAYARVSSHVRAKELAALRVKGREQVEQVWELDARGAFVSSPV